MPSWKDTRTFDLWSDCMCRGRFRPCSYHNNSGCCIHACLLCVVVCFFALCLFASPIPKPILHCHQHWFYHRRHHHHYYHWIIIILINYILLLITFWRAAIRSSTCMCCTLAVNLNTRAQWFWLFLTGRLKWKLLQSTPLPRTQDEPGRWQNCNSCFAEQLSFARNSHCNVTFYKNLLNVSLSQAKLGAKVLQHVTPLWPSQVHHARLEAAQEESGEGSAYLCFWNQSWSKRLILYDIMIYDVLAHTDHMRT